MKRRMSRRYKCSIIKLYWELASVIHNKITRDSSYYNSTVFFTLPKRQQFFTFFNLKTNKQLGFSTGVFLAKMGRKQKFFKRNPKNIMTLTLQLKKDYSFFFKKIYIYFIRNFNYRQYCLYKKIMDLITPKVFYFMHHQSFMPKFLKKKRIKRRVLKNLQRQ